MAKVQGNQQGTTREVGLPAKARASDGEKFAERFAVQYPGYSMVEFNPHLKTAVLDQLSNTESQCRRAVAAILGVKPWEIKVKDAAHGGFKIMLPDNYVPSKHHAKLQEVAEESVGDVGWIVEVDAKTLECEFIPSAPPSFPEMVPFPMDDLGQGNIDQTAFGLKLPPTGQDKHEPAVIDWEAQAFVLMGGMPGGGKRQPLNARIPVPLSARFPNGWATIGELELGDKVLRIDGAPLSLDDISPIVFDDVYEFELTDHQKVSSDPGHLWVVQRQRLIDSCEKSHGVFAHAHQWTTTSQVACGQRLEATAEMISQITKIPTHTVQSFLDSSGMPYRLDEEEQRYYPADEALAWLADHDGCSHDSALVFMTTLQLSQAPDLSDFRLPMARYSGALPELSDERMLAWEQNVSRVGLLLTPEILRAGELSKNRVYLVLRGLLNPQCSGVSEFWSSYGLSAQDIGTLIELLRSMGMIVKVHDDALEVEIAPAGHEIMQITKVESAPGVCIRVNDPSHIYLTEGFIPTHNTVTLNAIIADQLAKGAELVIADIPDKSIDFMWCKDFVRDGGWGCDSPEATLATLRMVYNEGSRRAKYIKKLGYVNYREMPEHERFKPVLIIVDEVAGLVVTDKIPSGIPKDHPIIQEKIAANLTRIEIMSVMEKIVSEMRFAGLRMVSSSQVTNANTGLGPTFKSKNGHRLVQGSNPSKPARNQAFNDESSVPTVPTHIIEGGRMAKGVGLAELEGSGSFVYKSFYDSPEHYREALLRLGVRTSNQPAPTSHEISLYAESLRETAEDVSGRRKNMGDPLGTAEAYGDDGQPLRGAARAAQASRVLAQQHANRA
ncbi:hypothetical protein [Glutamicibacter ardleyensis]|uniref:hypothetical protein n=1 Tax=Glutamicibacter ardleyensis TaxID=225894 RepID=UPI003FD6A816